MRALVQLEGERAGLQFLLGYDIGVDALPLAPHEARVLEEDGVGALRAEARPLHYDLVAVRAHQAAELAAFEISRHDRWVVRAALLHRHLHLLADGLVARRLPLQLQLYF